MSDARVRAGPRVRARRRDSRTRSSGRDSPKRHDFATNDAILCVRVCVYNMMSVYNMYIYIYTNTRMKMRALRNSTCV